MTIDPNKGRILANRYQLMDVLGTGAMGQVYRARDKLLGGVTVAVKFLAHTLLNQKMRERFEREATISALLGQKTIHIIRVSDYGVDENNVPYYVMEYLQGDSLSDIIQFEPLSLDRFLSLTRQICLGMESAHVGIVYGGELSPIIHRDIKPSNIFVIEDPTIGELVKILDFGIAKLIQSGDAQTHSFMGTLAYCSPEQMEGKELDSRSDIYSLGVMMYEMLTNEMPLLPETSSFGAWYKAHHEFKPRKFDSQLDVPEELKKLIMKCLAKSPSDRPQSVSEILFILDTLKNQNAHISGVRQPRARVIQDFKAETEALETEVFQNQKAETQRAETQRAETQRLDAQKAETQRAEETAVTSIQDIYWQLTWPEDKPRQKIVFPRLMNTAEGVLTSLWVMLDEQDIKNRKSSTRYNQFLFLSSPHPMILWITVIYNPKYGPRWLPCYLDLKTDYGEQVAKALAESGSYHILFFSVDGSDKCQHIASSHIAANQCVTLKKWVSASKLLNKFSQPNLSKKRLKQELEKIKPKILLKLEASYNK